MDYKTIDGQHKQLGILMNFNRLKICKILDQHSDMVSIDEIGKLTGLNRPNLRFHLATLNYINLLDSEMRVVKEPKDGKGYACRFYTLSKTGEEMFDYIITTVKMLETIG